MDLTEQSPASPPTSSPEVNLTTPADRRADVDAKHAQMAALLQELGCEGLLILDPDHFAWLTAGGGARGIVDPTATPALYFSGESRWVLCSNTDSQRLFDEELDGLGFQLKEWPWHWGCKQLLADICQGRKVASDLSFGECQVVADKLHQRRRLLTEYDRSCYRALGQILSHALEATGRTLSAGESEREVAGQLCHRLLHRGVVPLSVAVAADGRLRRYRQGGYTAMPITSSCVLTSVVRKYGLCTMASRSISFGPPEKDVRKDHDAACRISATYIAGSWPDAVPKQILATGRRVYQVCDAEHEWLLCPQGHITGRAPFEQSFTPQTEDVLQAHWAITWTASAGAALSCDTFVISDEGPKPITAVENWPLKKIRIQGADFMRPDILVR